MLKTLILDILQQHNSGPIPNGRLQNYAKMLGWKFKSPDMDVRQAIHELRVDGYPVCASYHGYWLGSYEDTETFIAEFERRIESQKRALEGLKEGLRAGKAEAKTASLFE